MGVLMADPICDDCGYFLEDDGTCQQCLRRQAEDAYWKEYERNAWLTSPNNDGRTPMFVKKKVA